MDNEAKFCGSSKEGIRGGVTKEGNIRGEVTDVATSWTWMDVTSNGDQTASGQIFFVAIFAFVGGYLAGRKSHSNVASKKLTLKFF